MKTKLLRRIHKEWEIMWHPDGVVIYKDKYPPCYSVGNIDINRQYFWPSDKVSKEEAFQTAKDYILGKVREDYSHLVQRKLRKPIKVWHV